MVSGSILSHSLLSHGLLPTTSLSMQFPRQEYWSGLPFPSPGDLPDSGIEPGSPTFQADALTSAAPGKLFIVDSKNDAQVVP